MAFFLKGVRVPHRKHTVGSPALRIPAPKSVTIPMSMHIGAPATNVVKVGDNVFVGTLIGEASGYVSSPVYSSVSGRVTKIVNLMLASGNTVPAVVIESDGKDELDPSITPPEPSTLCDFIEAVKKSGIVGLGGAGFPTHVKLNVEPERVDELIINGAECEPYITSDSYTMTDRVNDLECGINAIQKFLGVKRIVLGIEENKKEAIASMKALSSRIEGMEIKVLPSVYPQGGEKVLIYHTVKKTVPSGKLPIDVGCIVINCTTLAAIGKYLCDGIPLVEKCITVDGGAVKEPKNIIAPIGSPVSYLFEYCGGLACEPEKILFGGPMMGWAIPDIDSPVVKTTNAVLALTANEAKIPKTTACIRCGSCTNNCPFGLAAAEILRAYEKKDVSRLFALSVNSCMECGCCSFVCPANRPLVQTNKLAKALLKQERAKEAAKNGKNA